MSKTVENLLVRFNPIRQGQFFTFGDHLTGKITLVLAKDCKIASLRVKLKGKAEVKIDRDNSIKEKYFSIKKYMILERKENYFVAKGFHVLPFTFRIPERNLPPSFVGVYGKVVYSLEAKLSRRMRPAIKAKVNLPLIQNKKLSSDLSLRNPQRSMIMKTMNLFSSETVVMDVCIQRSGFYQGEGIHVVASIQNRSSRDIKPKYCLYAKYSYFAKGRRRVQTKDILKEVGDPIPPSAGQTVTRIITIPPTTCASILNCNILKVEYRLRVYLDVKFASDPQIKFPIVILPVLQGPEAEYESAHPTYGFGAFASPNMREGSDFLQNATTSDPSAPPPSYEAHKMYPLLDF